VYITWIIVGVCCNGQEKIKLDEEVSVKFWLQTLTLNQVLRVAILKTFEEAVENQKKKKKPTAAAASLSKNRNTGCNKRQNANLGTTSRNTKIQAFVGPAKGVKKVRFHTSLATVCCCFPQKFFFCWLNRPTCTASNT
jgi:hypothetical protein